ncbi:MAG: ACT domain-containing protein [Kiritimatiellae bacterium]|nr:ACT domain-containing protein [Kiritimatiellia bacterium]
MMEMKCVEAKRGIQLSVSVQNECGVLSRIAGLLGGAGVNVHALTLTGGIDHGDIRLVVDRNEEAAALLKAEGFLVFSREVVLLEIENRPGALGEVSALWAENGVNLEYAYCAGGPSVNRGLVVLRVDDVDKALDVLGNGK